MSSKKINFNSALRRDSFPHRKEKGDLRATVANLKHLFTEYGISYQYDEILRKQTIKVDGVKAGDLSEAATLATIKSLLALNDLPLATADLISALLCENAVNPVMDFITSKPWDNVDRLQTLCETLEVEQQHEKYKDLNEQRHERYRDLAVKTWLVQCVAAADGARQSPIPNVYAKYENVLVLQGSQGLGKSSWFKQLVPEQLRDYAIDGMHLDLKSRDSINIATSCWICEFGELDSMLQKKDNVSLLKAFLSSEKDRMRLPYDRITSSLRRHTSFGATVNIDDFLNDGTGARRYFPLAVHCCHELPRDFDHQQLWAQVWHLYLGGAQWWADKELESLLAEHHEKHSEQTVVSCLIADCFDLRSKSKSENSRLKHWTITQILKQIGVNNPTKDHLKDARHYLQRCGFKETQSYGIKGYWIACHDFEIPLRVVK